jgi:hypothetical protein
VRCIDAYEILCLVELRGPNAKATGVIVRRGSGTSIGPKVLIAAAVVVAGVIGISGIYPQVFDAELVPDTGTRLPVMSLSNPDARTKGIGTFATAASRRVVTTGQAMRSPPRTTLTPDNTQPQRATAEAAAPEVAAPLAVADVPEAQTKVEAATAPAPTTKVAERRKPIVKRKVVQVAHRRSFHGAYAQSNGWGWPGGGWGGQGPGFRF